MNLEASLQVVARAEQWAQYWSAYAEDVERQRREKELEEREQAAKQTQPKKLGRTSPIIPAGSCGRSRSSRNRPRFSYSNRAFFSTESFDSMGHRSWHLELDLCGVSRVARKLLTFDSRE